MRETQETRVRSLGREDPLEEERATHSSILAWRILWTEEPGGLHSTGRKEAGASEGQGTHSGLGKHEKDTITPGMRSGGPSPTQHTRFPASHLRLSGKSRKQFCTRHQVELGPGDGTRSQAGGWNATREFFPVEQVRHQGNWTRHAGGVRQPIGSVTTQAVSGGQRHLGGADGAQGAFHWPGDTGRTLTSDLPMGVAHKGSAIT